DLAAARGVAVGEGVAMPPLLAEAGLPERIPHGVGLAAHQLHRDRIDASHWRCAKAYSKGPLVDADAAMVERVPVREPVVVKPSSKTVESGGNGTRVKDP